MSVRYACSYERQSLSDDMGIDEQYRENCQRAREHGYLIPNDPKFRFSDNDVSGVTANRGEFQRLIQVVESGDAPFERVYVKDKTRLGRFDDPRQHTYYEMHLKMNGAPLRYSDKASDVDHIADGDDGIGHALTDVIDNHFTSKERKQFRARVAKGRRNLVINGFYVGAIAPYGTERWLATASGALKQPIMPNGSIRQQEHHYKLCWATNGTLDIVREIFQRLANGESAHGIAADLTRRGLPTPAQVQKKRGCQDGIWFSKTVTSIASNSIYIGVYVFRRTRSSKEPVAHTESKVNDDAPIRFEGFISDPPIDSDTWALVQQRLSGHRTVVHQRRSAMPDYPLSGLLRCTGCGQRFFGFTSTKAFPTRRRYYRHDTHAWQGRPACQWVHSYIRADEVEPPTLDVINTLLEDDRVVDLWNEQTTVCEASSDVRRLECELSTTKTDMDNTHRSMAAGAVMMMQAPSEDQRAAFQSGLDQLNSQLDLLRNRAGALEEELRALVSAREMGESLRTATRGLRAALAAADASIRHRALGAFIRSIDVCLESGTVDLCIGSL
jgi:Site-specific recombinases, DNA invertase Pin homologs